MKDWRKYTTDLVVVHEDHYIHYHTKYDTFHFKIRYVRHNGFTRIMVVADGEYLSVFGKQFIDWFEMHSRYNTRYEKQGWWKPIRRNRRKKLTIWAVSQIREAYKEFTKIAIDEPIKNNTM